MIAEATHTIVPTAGGTPVKCAVQPSSSVRKATGLGIDLSSLSVVYVNPGDEGVFAVNTPVTVSRIGAGETRKYFVRTAPMLHHAGDELDHVEFTIEVDDDA